MNTTTTKQNSNASAAGHTPGPYMAREYTDVRTVPNGHGYEIEAHPDFNAGLPVAVCSGPDCAANARLIAAAPGLLEALTQAQSALRTVALRIDYRDDELIAYAHAEANKAYEPIARATSATP